jgi:hypothetical protein
MEEHLLSLGIDGDDDGDLNFDNNNSSDDDSSVEIMSTIDECENELIRLSTYLQLESEVDNDDDDQTFEWPDPPPCLFSSCSSDTDQSNTDQSNNDQSNDSQQVLLATSSIDTAHSQEKSIKRKRRQWSIKEKLDAIALFEKNHSKRQTANEKGCTTAQLRNWIKSKENLYKMCKQKKGSFLFYFS